jgi:hypothetical protein
LNKIKPKFGEEHEWIRIEKTGFSALNLILGKKNRKGMTSSLEEAVIILNASQLVS